MKKKTAVTIALTVIAAVLLATQFFAVQFTQSSIEDQVVSAEIEQREILAKAMARSVELRVDALEKKLRIAREIPAVRNAEQGCGDALELVLQVQSAFDIIGFTGVDGEVKCSTESAAVGLNVSELTHIQNIFNDPEHKPVVARVVRSPVEGEFSIAVVVPVYRDGVFAGVLGGRVPLKNFREAFTASVSLPRNAVFALIDDDGTLLHTPQEELIGENIFSSEVIDAVSLIGPGGNITQRLENILASEETVLQYTTTNTETGESQERIGVFAAANIQGDRQWIVALAQPANQLRSVAGADVFISLYSFIAIFTAVSFALLLIYIVLGVFKPLDEIRGVIEEISLGDLDVKSANSPPRSNAPLSR